jgi:hypothetical protein
MKVGGKVVGAAFAPAIIGLIKNGAPFPLSHFPA